MKLTKHEKRFRNLMWAYFLIFLAGGISFYRLPEKTIGDIVTFGTWLGFDEFEPVKDRFWVILSVANMMTISACCFIASLNVRSTMNYAIPVFISKLTSSGLGIREFIISRPHGFHYLVIALVDFPLFLIAFLFYIKAAGSKGGDEKKEAISKKTDSEGELDISE